MPSDPIYSPMSTGPPEDGVDSEEALARMKAKAKRFEILFFVVAAVLVVWIVTALLSSPDHPAETVPWPQATGATSTVGQRWHAPAAISSELRVWDPTDVEFFELPRPAGAGTHGYYQYPSYRNGVMTFVSEGDIWRAPEGLSAGLAARITSRSFAAGSVVDAELSPDGRMVAFTATVDGGRDAFIMPVSGGTPQRVTYGEGALVRGWSSSTAVLFTTRTYSDLPDERLVSVGVGPDNGGQRVVHEVSQACDGVVEMRTGCLFFTRIRQNSMTKRYMGGTAEKLWRYCPGDAEAAALTSDFDGTDRSPMLYGGRVYFLSDRSGVMNVWSMNTDGSNKRAVTALTCYGVAEASVGEGGDGVMVYRSGGSLFSLRLEQATNDVVAGSEIDITLLSDRAQLQEHWVNGQEWLSWTSVSPDGSRVAMISRGVLFTAPVPVGKNRHQVGGRLVQVAPNITNGGGQRFEAATWVNNSHLLAVADTAPTGELGFFLAPADGLGSIEEIGGPANAETVGFGRGGHDMIISPDGNKIVWTDHEARMWLAGLSSPTERTLLAEGVTFAPFGGSPASFSPDSTHLAINMNTRANMGAIFLYRLATDETPAEGPIQLTEGRSNCWAPVWTPSALFFLSDRELHNEVGSPWGSRGPLPKFSSTARIYAIPLQVDADSTSAHLLIDDPTELSPWPEPAERFNCSSYAPFETAIDFQQIGDLRKKVRVIPNVAAGDVDSLTSFACGSALLFTQDGELMAVPLTAPFSEDDAAAFTIATGVRSFEATTDGALMTMGQSNDIKVGVAPSVAALRILKMQRPVGLDQWMISLQPQGEFTQIYRDAWRMMRDYFWDPHMNGNDWDMMRERYEALLPRVGTREELDDVISQLVAELCALHVFISPARDSIGERSPHAQMSSLGATLERDVVAGGYVVTRVFHQEPDLAASKRPSPLDRPLCGSAAVPEGSVIEAVNGVPLLSLPSPGFALRNQAGQQVRLSLRYASDLDISTEVVIAPISQVEFDDLRYSDWEASRRQIVEEAGGGRIGYIHVRSTSGSAYTDFARQFFPVFDRDALIVDVRHNSGGNQDSWMLEQLRHNVWMFFQERYGSQNKEASWNTQMAFRGHMVALCDEKTSSDGEAFIAGFQENGLGTVIGVRTWGGEIWLSRDNRLVDGGIASAPEMGVFGLDGEWFIENRGAIPDIVVDNLPHATFLGEDAQLRRGVAELLSQLQTDPIEYPVHPPYPDRSYQGKLYPFAQGQHLTAPTLTWNVPIVIGPMTEQCP